MGGTCSVNGKVMPLLEHTSDTHPFRPSSSVAYSKTSACMATGRNSFKPLKPRRAFKLHRAKIGSATLQLHGKLGIVALTRTNYDTKWTSTRHRQCAAESPHSYITLAAAAKPHQACKIKFLEDYYSHVLVTYTQFGAASIFNTIQQLLTRLKNLDNMADDMDRNGARDCHRFHNGTNPVCAVEDQLGHMCQPCLRQTVDSNASCPPGLAACSTTASTRRCGGKG
jgi:hypothetical protein